MRAHRTENALVDTLVKLSSPVYRNRHKRQTPDLVRALQERHAARADDPESFRTPNLTDKSRRSTLPPAMCGSCSATTTIWGSPTSARPQAQQRLRDQTTAN